MFADQFAGAISCAQFSDLNALAHKLWKAHAAGHLDDETAQRLAEQLEARKPKPSVTFQDARCGVLIDRMSQRQRSPDKQASIERRRRLAACWPLPPDKAAHFTTCEQAVLRVIADEMKRYGICTSCNAKVAAIAGTCITVVKNALRKAKALRLLTVEERRRAGQRSLTNLVRFLSMAWKAWIARKGSGVRKTTTTNDGFKPEGQSKAVERFAQSLSMKNFASSVPP
jgi:hypothetical protein